MLRLKAEHPNDEDIISNDRVKGRLKVTRAFGAGFLKQVTICSSLCDNLQKSNRSISVHEFMHMNVDDS